MQRRGLPTKVLALSSYSDDHYVRGMLEAGAVGYLLKSEALLQPAGGGEGGRLDAGRAAGWADRTGVGGVAAGGRGAGQQRDRPEVAGDKANCGVSRRQHPEEVGNGLAGRGGDVGEGVCRLVLMPRY